MRGLPLEVPDMLANLGAIYRERGASYGKNYHWAGTVLWALFEGRPVTFSSPEELNRLHLVVHMAGKLSRYVGNLHRGGHRDSLDDLSVYAQMAQEYDAMFRDREYDK